jgi:VanZ family protein
VNLNLMLKQMVMKRLSIRFTLWLAVVAATATGELLPGSSVPMRFVSWTGVSDKLLHFGAYLLISLLAVLLFRRRVAFALAGGAVLLGVTLEFVQKLVPGRSFEIRDMTANTLGVFVGLMAIVCAKRRLAPGTRIPDESAS